MSKLRNLQELGQSIWLDNITRDLLTSGTLQDYIETRSVTGLTSNPTIFFKAISGGDSYDRVIVRHQKEDLAGESLFFALALEDITEAADLFAATHERTSRVDGWVSLEVSPRLAYDAARTVAQAEELHARTARPNVFIKIPGTREGLPAIEEATFKGVPVNITLLFSESQYVAAADAYWRGIERRIDAGLNPNVASVASVFISRWDVAINDRVPEELRNTLGIAVGQHCYRTYRERLMSRRFTRIMNKGGRPQRLLFASTGTKDPDASDVLYVDALAAPLTINTIPESTLHAFDDHGEATGSLADNGGSFSEVLAAHGKAGIDIEALGNQLQQEGAESFVRSWDELLSVVANKSVGLTAGA